jgi:hypothetical protein
MLFFLSFFLTAETVLSKLLAVSVIPLPLVPHIVPSSTVDHALAYSHNTTAST